MRAPFLKMDTDPDSPGAGNEKLPVTSPICVLLRTFLQTLSVLDETAHALFLDIHIVWYIEINPVVFCLIIKQGEKDW